ncbi:E3 ubiquitin-protein ligase rififylin isoform X1 [Nothobranchius furzeri]|uniref:E3 ubiquitin-protein ligase rififylin isoform X1 n=2 Tax=Nothobranchius furzeri TaxID=105023 RepID=UPI0024043FC4|nr:E3 ubiquitin-protein ligase rififylin isoform X1 [Nothobranchius furzeri]
MRFDHHNHMFASCCNWLCMDSGDVSPSSGPERRHQSFTNSPPEHTCKACGGAFDTPAKKHMCVDCKKNYCCRCSAQRELRPRLCHTCQRFYGNLLQRAELMKLKVKELRDYLHLHEVSTHLCREKEELVELVLSQQASPSSSFTPDTPIIDPATATSNLPDDLLTSNPPMPRISDPPTDVPIPASSTPEPEALLPESETPPPEPTLQDEDQNWDSEEAAVSGRRASLSDLNNVEDIEELSVRQLKEILARNFVNYKGCCEKWELMERVTRLYQDQQNLLAVTLVNAADCSESGHGSAPPGLEENLCKICMDSPIDCVLLECGHMVTCTKCGKRMSECPICRQYVIRAVHVFRS